MKSPSILAATPHQAPRQRSFILVVTLLPVLIAMAVLMLTPRGVSAQLTAAKVPTTIISAAPLAAAPCQSTLDPGVALLCSISSAAEVDTFTINGAVGDVLLFRASRVSNTLQPWLRVYDPNGLKSCEGRAERFVELGCTLTRSGTYTVEVTDASAAQTNTGDYRLYVQRLNNPGSAPSLSYGLRTTDQIQEPAEVDTYTVDGVVDDKLLLRMTRGSETVQPWLRVYGPTGSKICEGFADRFFEISCTLPSSGRYSLVIADSSAGRVETGVYSLELQRLNNPGAGTPIAFGETSSSRLDTPARLATYTFTGAVDDVVFMRAFRTSDVLQPWVRIYTPLGDKLCEGFNARFVEFSCRLPSSGSYTVLVSDSTQLRELTGGYDLFLQRLNAPGLARSLDAYGQTIQDGVDLPARVDTFTIEGQVDDRVLARVHRLGNTVQPWLRMYSPIGDQVCEGFAERFFEIECTLPRSGRYTLLLADSTAGRGETGTYSLYIQRLNNPGNAVALRSNSSVSGAIKTATGLDSYTISGEVDTLIDLRMRRTSDTLQPWMRLYDPRGTRICEGFNATDAEIRNCKLPRTGAYTLLVGDASPSRTELGSYTLALNCQSLVCSDRNLLFVPLLQR